MERSAYQGDGDFCITTLAIPLLQIEVSLAIKVHFNEMTLKLKIEFVSVTVVYLYLLTKRAIIYTAKATSF